MGKATALDLPDPMQSPPPGTQTSTDDLLAQLAGEEIDRLLAEADGSEVAPTTPAPASAASVPLVVPTEPASAAPVGNGAVTIDPGAPAQPAADLDVTAELDELFSSAVAKDKAEAEAPAAPQPTAPAIDAPATADELADQTTDAERAGLSTSVGDAASGKAAAARTVAEIAGLDRPLPAYLRPLEWLNAPLAGSPASIRDLIGKAAIITLFNAAAIFVYVMLFRRG